MKTLKRITTLLFSLFVTVYSAHVFSEEPNCLQLPELKKMAGDANTDNFFIHPGVFKLTEKFIRDNQNEDEKTFCNTPITLYVYLSPILPVGQEKLFQKNQAQFSTEMSRIPNAAIIRCLDIVNVCMIAFPAKELLSISQLPTIQQIYAYNRLDEETVKNLSTIGLLSKKSNKPQSWWKSGVDGSPTKAGKAVIAIIDSGVDIKHPALQDKTFYLQDDRPPRSAHGTGIACILASEDATDKGVAYGVKDIIVGFSGLAAEEGNRAILNSMSATNWMYTDLPTKPTVLNYSLGADNTDESDWGLSARFFDAVAQGYQTTFVKSAGNASLRDVHNHYQSGWDHMITTPGDNYNGITVGNMNIGSGKDVDKFTIASLSRRGPTEMGRRKPDISAPGTGSYTCGIEEYDQHGKPMPQQGEWNEDKKGYWRTMGGTSAAAPYVGGGAALLNTAGILDPKTIKAILINSADAWTDNGVPGSKDRAYPAENRPVHHPVQGSEWNRTYGWGFLNLKKAYEQRDHWINNDVTPAGKTQPARFYKADASLEDKFTLVWERRVGIKKDKTWYKLTHLDLQLYDDQGRVIHEDTSAIDNVKQVANFPLNKQAPDNDADYKGTRIITVKNISESIDGADKEPFSLASSVKLVELKGPQLSLNKSFFRGWILSNHGDLPVYDATLILVDKNNETKTITLPALDPGESQTILKSGEVKALNSADVKSEAFGYSFYEKIK